MSCYNELAELVEYPRADLPAVADRCLGLAGGDLQPGLREFLRQAELLGVPRMQELYIETFDFRPETSAYVGHHLFGEDIRRNLFLAQLRERYREAGLDEGGELPDHLSNLLRFLGAAAAGEERTELIRDCLIPALRHLLRALKPENTYATLLQAILLALGQEGGCNSLDGERAWKPFSSLSSPTSR